MRPLFDLYQTCDQVADQDRIMDTGLKARFPLPKLTARVSCPS